MRRSWGLVVVLGVGLLLFFCGVILILRSAASPGSLVVAGLTVAVICAIASRVEIAGMIRTLETLRVLFPILAFSIVGALVGSREGTLPFDEIGAQLIVVLLLALALEARFFRVRDGEDRLDVFVSIYVMALLAVGEFYALGGVLDHRPRHAEMVAGAVAAGFAAVAVSAMLGQPQGAPGPD